MCDWSWKWSYILFFQDLERINKNRKLKPYKNGKYILFIKKMVDKFCNMI